MSVYILTPTSIGPIKEVRGLQFSASKLTDSEPSVKLIKPIRLLAASQHSSLQHTKQKNYRYIVPLPWYTVRSPTKQENGRCSYPGSMKLIEIWPRQSVYSYQSHKTWKWSIFSAASLDIMLLYPRSMNSITIWSRNRDRSDTQSSWKSLRSLEVKLFRTKISTLSAWKCKSWWCCLACARGETTGRFSSVDPEAARRAGKVAGHRCS